MERRGGGSGGGSGADGKEGAFWALLISLYLWLVRVCSDDPMARLRIT